ncbi:MAG: HDIG domain-containing protein [Thermoanaerobaculum sp.]|nr:HDIG domain-containing protein [Thermoanaerobaculum sp.]
MKSLLHHQGRTGRRRGSSGSEWGQRRRRFLAQWWLLGPAFVVLVTLLITPRQATRYPLLRPGDIAPRDIVVHRDVTLPDVESTEQKRRQAGLDVPPVYLLDPSVAQQVKAKLASIIAAGQGGERETTKELAALLSQAAGQKVEEDEAKVLRALGFSQDLLLALSDLVDQLYRQGVVEDRVELLRWADKGVTVRELVSNRETVQLDVFRFVDAAALAETLEQRLAVLRLGSREHRPILARWLARLMPPNVLLDRGETLARRMRAAANVEEVSIHLNRGRVLLRRGDEVSPQVARLLESLAASAQGRPTFWPLFGGFGITALIAVMWFFYFRRESLADTEKYVRYGSVLLVLFLSLVLEGGLAFVVGQMAAAVIREPFNQVTVYWPVLPHATGPVIASLMFGVSVGVLFAASQAVLVALMLAFPGHATAYALLTAVAAAFATQKVKERNALTKVGLFLAAFNVLCAVALALHDVPTPQLPEIAAHATTAALGGIMAVVLSSFFLPVLESVTGTITDIRLLELSNPNLPLLRRLATEAPGTFQHSLAMANLAEAAAEAIGANPLLARVCCYYHDVGKLVRPEYFIENQRGGPNPHDHLSPWMSALVVSKHVKDGLELARQYKLPEPVREAIATHHGTKLIHFFYNRAKQQATPDTGDVEEQKFRYPGPKPKSKEMGIILLADAVEAAARTLSEPTPGRVQNMIDQVIKRVLEDGQLDECELTLKDLEKISSAFSWVITSAGHHRIDYPGFDFNRRGNGR